MGHNVLDIKHSIRRDRDSIFTYLFARTISVRVTPCLAGTKITPLNVTSLGLVFGLLAALISSYSNWGLGLVAAFFIEVSHIMDCIDGELARITDRGNEFAASMDPISDRIKDMAIVFAAYINSLHSSIFGFSIFSISIIAMLTLGTWFLYLYIVDAYLNPARKSMMVGKQGERGKLYLGLYDLFIYGSIIFLIFGIFEYFIIYILIISIVAIPIQLYRLKKIYTC